VAIPQGQTDTVREVAPKLEASMAQTPGPRHEPPTVPVSCPPRKRIATADLMQGAREILVLHHGEEYRLRITKTGKLILTK
jgi:hemin uptake protein HemP